MQPLSLFPLHQSHLVLDLGDVGVDSLRRCLKCLQSPEILALGIIDWDMAWECVLLLKQYT